MGITIKQAQSIMKFMGSLAFINNAKTMTGLWKSLERMMVKFNPSFVVTQIERDPKGTLKVLCDDLYGVNKWRALNGAIQKP